MVAAGPTPPPITRKRGYFADPASRVAQRDTEAIHRFLAPRLLGATYTTATSNRPFVSTSKGGPGILDQDIKGATGSCTGHGSAGAATARFAISGNPVALLSPIQLYGVGRSIDNPPVNGVYPPLVDQGAQPNQVVRGAMTFGIASAASYGNYPADPATINDFPTPAQLEAAGEFLLTGAYFLDDNTDPSSRILGFIKALTAGYPVTNSVQASGDAFQGYSGGVLTSAQLTGDLDHYTYAIDYAWTGSSADWQSFLSALTTGSTSIWQPMLSQLVGFFVNSWNVTWGWSDVSGLAGGFYQADGTAVAGMADMCVWNVTPTPEANA